MANRVANLRTSLLRLGSALTKRRAVVATVVAASLSAVLLGSAFASNWTIQAASGSHGEAQAAGGPAGPSGLLAGCGSTKGTIGLVWTLVAHASSYVILDSTTAASGPYTTLASGVSLSAYQTGVMTSNRNYWFEVEAQVGSNWVGAKSAASNEVKISTSGNCST